MSAHTPLQRAVLWALTILNRYRYIKFGIVGASGTVVNLVVLHVGHAYLFSHLAPLYNHALSLGLAITLATINNFTWNRLWTWSDRVRALEAEVNPDSSISLRLLGVEFGQYAVASAFGIAIQVGLTLLLSKTLDIRLANVIAILAASASNFLANDAWTFKRHK